MSASRMSLALCTALLLAGLTGVAGAALVPQKSIRGVGIGETVKAVRAELGTPDAVHYAHDEIIGRVRSERYGLTTVRYDGTARSARVIAVETRSRLQRYRGAGVGSTRAQVLRAVPTAACSPPAAASSCTLGRFLAGHRVTTFTFGAGGLVREVSVGVVID